MSITGRILAILWLLWLALPALVQSAPKSEVALFEYAGVAEGQPTSAKFGAFRGILMDKIANLKREVLQGEDSHFAYLEEVHLSFHDKDNFSKPESINKWLKNQSSVLCLLRGTIISDDNVTYLVKSSFHLGELHAYFPYDVVRITLPVSSSEFGNTQDSHSVVILYSLAMDARRLGYDKDQIARFLTVAVNKLADIKRRSGPLSGDLAELESAILKATNELLGGT